MGGFEVVGDVYKMMLQLLGVCDLLPSPHLPWICRVFTEDIVWFLTPFKPPNLMLFVNSSLETEY
jgi:hypothetical protein